MDIKCNLFFSVMSQVFYYEKSVHSMREKVGVKVVKALSRNSDAITHAALDMLCTLMQV